MRDCPSLVLGANKILFGHLKFSYEILENQIETKCFLFCCMYCDDLKIVIKADWLNLDWRRFVGCELWYI